MEKGKTAVHKRNAGSLHQTVVRYLADSLILLWLRIYDFDLARRRRRHSYLPWDRCNGEDRRGAE